MDDLNGVQQEKRLKLMPMVRLGNRTIGINLVRNTTRHCSAGSPCPAIYNLPTMAGHGDPALQWMMDICAKTLHALQRRRGIQLSNFIVVGGFPKSDFVSICSEIGLRKALLHC